MSSAKLPLRLQLLAGILLLVPGYFVAQSTIQNTIEVGDRAPNFKVVTDNGRTISRSDFGGKVLVLNFWATWCPPCIEEIPSLDALQKQMGRDGVVVLAVSVDKNEKTYKNFMQRSRVDFLTARDPSADISAEYGTFKYPETYIINSSGKVIAKYISNQNWVDPKILQEIRSAM